ncbi:LuxR C-terminal-related transcriptional regulator [Rhizobium sp. DKSPLA3]|uniref:LuxR C-terminal-related transcriptional regulator n=1 Tax=Rhizobium quercicola TaxID=2901226 RepID=A0A9X1NMN3_9HYPH|nr:LuxR C-terminal-related transcriptional regulator [Rhizobium quercicola]MCD7107917.1 LuxR C-terminal-related transcriptional regulator [Rhizobium quercicola]
MTVLLAPAGYGKTSLAAQWYHALLAQGVNAAWVSLGPDDGDQSRFLLALIEALDHALDHPAKPVDAGSMSVATLLSVLVTRLQRVPPETTLFLDDYHASQTDGTEALIARLLSHDDIGHIRFVLVSRSAPRFPTSALRLAGDVRQIGLAELGFSDDEAQAFFGGSDAALSVPQLKSLNQRAEGWPVALQMMRMLLEETGADSPAILSAFKDRSGDMGLYLSEQVFSGLSTPLQRLLLETSSLPAIHRDLVSTLCDETTAGAFASLRDQALPIAVLDDEGRWLRLHPVLTAFLKEEAARLGIDSAAILARAARWFAGEGDLEAAVEHAFAARAPALAAEIIEAAGGWRRVYTTSRGGAALFRKLSDEAAQIDLAAYPLTTLGLAVVSAKAAQLDAADYYLEIASRSADAADEALSSALRVVRVLVSLYTDRWVSSADLGELERDLGRASGRELVHRALSLNMLSYNFLIRTDLDRALHYGNLAMQAFRDGGADFGALHLYTHIGQASFFRGDMTSAEEAYDRLIAEVAAHIGRGSDFDAVGHVLKCEVLSMRGDIAEAGQALAWALPHVERHDTWLDPLAAGLLAQQRVLILSGDRIGAHAAMDRARATAGRRGFDRLVRMIDGERVALLIASGDLAEAARYAEATGFGEKAARADQVNDLSLRLRGTVPALLWVRMHLAEGRLEVARDLLSRLETSQARKPHVVRQIELRLLGIRLAMAAGDTAMAASRLSDLVLGLPVTDYRAVLLSEGPAFMDGILALAHAAPVPQVVLQRLLQTAGSPSAIVPKTGGLTEREQAVMQLLSEGLGNKDIGRRLSLSDNTVKFHLRNIYAKFGVTTRTAAAAAARTAGLLP